MKKSIFFLMVAAVVAVGFSACSKGGEKQSEDTPNSVTQSGLKDPVKSVDMPRSKVVENQRDETPNSLQQDGLKGAVKSVDMLTYEASSYFGEIQKGDLIREEVSWSNFPLCAGIRYDYNTDGNLVKFTITDDEGKITSMQKKEYIRNYLVGEKQYNEDGKLMIYWRYELKNGKPVSIIMTTYGVDDYAFSSESTHSDTIESTFDGFLLKSTCFKSEGKIVSRSENKYEKGLIVSSVNYNSDNSTAHVEYKRNAAGILTQLRVYGNNGDEFIEDMTIDNRGFLTRYRQSGFSEKKDYTMEYLSVDNHGNWTSRAVYKDELPLYLQERTIQYYENK